MANIAVSALPTGAATGGEIFVCNQSGTTKALTLSSDALSDYEEGTWTPTVYGSTVAGTPTYVANVGIYIRVGSLIWLNYRVQLSSKGGATGQMRVQGLPFTCLSGTQARAASIMHITNDYNLSAGYEVIAGYVENNTTEIYLTKIGASDGDATLLDTDLNDGFTFYSTAIYQRT